MDVVIYLVFIGLGMLFGYVIGYGRNLAHIEIEYERSLGEYYKQVDAWQKEYLKLYEKYRALQDSMCIEEIEDVK